MFILYSVRVMFRRMVFGVVVLAVAGVFGGSATSADAAGRESASNALVRLSPSFVRGQAGGDVHLDLVADPGSETVAVWIIEVGTNLSGGGFTDCAPIEAPAGATGVGDCQLVDETGGDANEMVKVIGAILFNNSGEGLAQESILASLTLQLPPGFTGCALVGITIVALADPDGVEIPRSVDGGGVCLEGELPWPDADCDLSLTSRDNQAILRTVLQQSPLSQYPPCDEIGAVVAISGAGDRLWADADCDGAITSRDNQAVMRYVLKQTPLDQAEPCPDVGQAVTVS